MNKERILAGRRRRESAATVGQAEKTPRPRTNPVALRAAVADALPAELSGGQCQRVAVARAVIVPPSLLLCDEPISAMDVSLAAQALNLIGALRRRLGMAMLFVTHDLAAARIVADRIVVLREGKIVEDGPADAVVRDPQADYTRQLIASMPDAPRSAA